MEKLLVSTVEQRPPVNVRPSRGQFSIEPHAFFHTGLEREREQPCPVKPVDTENAENKTRRPTTRGGLRLFTLSRGINTGGGGETREKPRQKSSCNAVWVTRIYQIRFLFSSRGTRYRFNTNRVCSLARIVDCSNFSNFLVICNFCNSIFDECSFRCLNRYSILLYLL